MKQLQAVSVSARPQIIGRSFYYMVPAVVHFSFVGIRIMCKKHVDVWLELLTH
jgi:hypothetical protein